MIREASLSACGRYRMNLLRRWDPQAPHALFIGVNPSVADATVDDATIRKMVGFAKRWGYGGFEVVNLFAYRATNVRELAGHYDTSRIKERFPDEHAVIVDAMLRSALVVPCWGSRLKLPESLHHRITWVEQSLRRPAPGQWIGCFGRTSSGDPKHPVMLGYNTKLERY